MLLRSTQRAAGLIPAVRTAGLNPAARPPRRGFVLVSVRPQMLLKIPTRTEDVANSILDWLDAKSSIPRTNGAKDEFYPALDPPYHVKNGAMDTLDELLLVKGVTPQLLYGNDRNRNG